MTGGATLALPYAVVRASAPDPDLTAAPGVSFAGHQSFRRLVDGRARFPADATLPRTVMPEASHPESSGEVELGRRLRRRDESVVGALYDRFGESLLGLAHRILHDQSDAEDVVVEAFAQAWRDAVRFDPDRGSLGAWLVTITRSRALDAVRARNRRLRLTDQAAATPAEAPPGMGSRTPEPSVRAIANERRTFVRQALDRLSDVQREAIELAYFGGLSQSEIADRLQEPLGTIKTRTRLGMQYLREALLAYHESTDG